MPTHRKRVLVTLVFVQVSLGSGCAAHPRYTAVLDATWQRANAPRGRGPFPGSDSTSARHSADFPILLEVRFPAGALRKDGTALVDFVLTNIGTATVCLPSELERPHIADDVSVLTLWLTSDAIVKPYAIDVVTHKPFRIEAVGTSADLYGDAEHHGTCAVLKPRERLLVHALSRVHLKAGVHDIRSHAELTHAEYVPGRGWGSKSLGWADSASVRAHLHTAVPR